MMKTEFFMTKEAILPKARWSLEFTEITESERYDLLSYIRKKEFDKITDHDKGEEIKEFYNMPSSYNEVYWTVKADVAKLVIVKSFHNEKVLNKFKESIEIS